MEIWSLIQEIGLELDLRLADVTLNSIMFGAIIDCSTIGFGYDIYDFKTPLVFKSIKNQFFSYKIIKKRYLFQRLTNISLLHHFWLSYSFRN